MAGLCRVASCGVATCRVSLDTRSVPSLGHGEDVLPLDGASTGDPGLLPPHLVSGHGLTSGAIVGERVDGSGVGDRREDVVGCG